MKGTDLEDIIKSAQQRYEERIRWLQAWRRHVLTLPPLPADLWLEEKLVLKLPLPRLDPSTKVSAVDGGIVAEELRGFDIALSRAVAVTFSGVGKKVEVEYYPAFDPPPVPHIRQSFRTRQDFSKFTTLVRLLREYQVAGEWVLQGSPDVLFLDGSVLPLLSDLAVESDESDLHGLQQEVVAAYSALVDACADAGTLLMGVVKDSRSRLFTRTVEKSLSKWGDSVDVSTISRYLPETLDYEFATSIISEGGRSSWFRLRRPSYLVGHEIFASMVRPLRDDDAVRVEVVSSHSDPKQFELGLQAFYILCQHGLPLAIPTVLSEADRHTKLGRRYIEDMVNQVSLKFGIPIEKLKKRRNFEGTMTDLHLD